ncbi:MAG: hypothetical protein V1694_07900 [Candidatus Eisenbacteria bacterium]
MAEKSVLCCLSDSGGAHRTIAEALRENLDGDFKFEVVDLYRATSRFCSSSVGSYPRLLRGFPRFYNFFYDLNDSRLGWDFFYGCFIRRRMKERTKRILLERKPDVVVSLSALTSRIVADSIHETDLEGTVPLVVLVVDPFTVHRAWIESRSDLVLVASLKAKDRLVANRVRENMIKIVRYPIRAGFCEARDREDLRMRYGITKGAQVALVMGGGDGVLPVDKISGALLGASSSMHVIAVAGRNDTLHRRLQGAAGLWSGRLTAAGHSDHIPEFMTVSDVIITKPGPSTIMEAIESELPIVLTGFISRQERGNVDYVLSRGLGVYIEQRTIAEACRLCSDKKWISQVKANMRREKTTFTETIAPDSIRAVLDGHDETGIHQVS